MFQWGIGADFWTLIIAYLVVQGLDGNLLVPILFSEAVNLHPLVIILSVIIFGGLWGFWGVFFAIPLATTSSKTRGTRGLSSEGRGGGAERRPATCCSTLSPGNGRCPVNI